MFALHLFVLAMLVTELTALLPVVLPALLGVGVSYLTELVTKWHAPRVVKSLVNVALAAAAGAVATVAYPVASGDWKVDLVGYLSAVGLALAASVITHYTGATAGVQQATKDFGIGPKEDPYLIDTHDQLYSPPRDEEDVPNPARPL